MRIELKTLPEGRSVISQKVEMTEEQSRDGRISGTVICSAVIDALQYHIHMAVSYECAINMECSRCCRDFIQTIRGNYRLVLRDRNAPRNSSEDEETADFLYGDEDIEIDTRSSLYDEIVIATPMMPLCGPDCRGVSAGTTGSTESGQKIDPRWEALRKLKISQG